MAWMKTTVLEGSPTTSNTGAGGAATTTAPVFVTKETLLTFAGQTAAATLIWKLVGGEDGSKLIPAAAVAVMSLAIWFTGLNALRKTPTEIPLSLVIAGINALMVYAAVIGADVTGDQTGVSDATNPAIEDAAE